jgi:hypothetical protein
MGKLAHRLKVTGINSRNNNCADALNARLLSPLRRLG